MRRQVKEYVVTRAANAAGSVGELLRSRPDVAVIEELGDSTALVTMSDKVRDLLAREYEGVLHIEANLPYRLASEPVA